MSADSPDWWNGSFGSPKRRSERADKPLSVRNLPHHEFIWRLRHPSSDPNPNHDPNHDEWMRFCNDLATRPLSESQVGEVVHVLLGVADGDNRHPPPVRAAALKALAHFHASPAVSIPGVCKALAHDPEESVRIAAANLLGVARRDAAVFVPLLVEVLDGVAVGHLLRKAVVGALCSFVRFERMRSEMPTDHSTAAIRRLCELLGDSNEMSDIRWSAAQVVRTLPFEPSTMLDPLASGVRGASDDVRRESLRAVRDIGPDAIPALRQAVIDSAPKVVDDVIECLDQLLNKTSASSLSGQPDPANTHLAPGAATKRPDVTWSIPAVLDRLGSQNHSLSAAASRILQYIGPGSLPAIEERIRNLGSGPTLAAVRQVEQLIRAELPSQGLEKLGTVASDNRIPLQKFYLVGCALRDGFKGLRGVSKEFSRAEREKTLPEEMRGVSHNNLSEVINTLERGLFADYFRRDPNDDPLDFICPARKGGSGVLTPDGERAWEATRNFLTAIRAIPEWVYLPPTGEQ